MRFPVLTTTEAPQWFSQAFEDAEREFVAVCDLVYASPGEGYEWEFGGDCLIYASEQDMFSHAAIDGDVILDYRWLTLAEIVSQARQEGLSEVVLTDGKGQPVKRWSVLA